jgi:hypothetical protein
VAIRPKVSSGKWIRTRRSPYLFARIGKVELALTNTVSTLFLCEQQTAICGNQCLIQLGQWP